MGVIPLGFNVTNVNAGRDTATLYLKKGTTLSEDGKMNIEYSVYALN